MSNRTPDGSLVLVLVAPETRKRMLGVTLDGFKLLTGKTIEEHLGAFLTDNPVSVVNDETGAQEVAYTIRIPAGAGFVIPMGPLGELGLAHARDGILSLTCPLVLVDTFNGILRDEMIQTSEPDQVEHNGQVLQQFFLRTTPGLEVGFQLPKLGALRIGRPS